MQRSGIRDGFDSRREAEAAERTQIDADNKPPVRTFASVQSISMVSDPFAKLTSTVFVLWLRSLHFNRV